MEPKFQTQIRTEPVAIVPETRFFTEHPERRKVAMDNIKKFRDQETMRQTHLIVHNDASIRRYMITVFPNLINRLKGKVGCIPCSWEVGFYYALNDDNQLIFYVIPTYMDESGEPVDFFSPKPGYEDVYSFKDQARANDDDEIAYDFGHIRPTYI